ncbi:MAG TPA: hypothetical protein VM733_22010 [Thermoanaerobaculia bacterium]|nr:hypothetical protein [Thermoanaerobaculia bacterium]
MTIAHVLALLTTIAVETLIVSLILRRFVWLPALIIQLATWPIAQLLVTRGANLWLVECGVFVAEGILWRFILPTTWRRAAWLSFAANGVTTLIAVAIAALR